MQSVRASCEAEGRVKHKLQCCVYLSAKNCTIKSCYSVLVYKCR